MIGSDERDGGDRHHEVSILIGSCLMVGRWRGTQPAAIVADDGEVRLPIDARASVIVLAAQLEAVQTLMGSIEKRIKMHSWHWPD